MIDNDQPGLDIRQLRETSPNTFVADTSTEVLEGAAGFSDAYSVTLTAAPTAGETVTVTLSTNTQITAVSKETGLPYLTFTSANWNIAQIVLVNAVDDPLDGVEQVDSHASDFEFGRKVLRNREHGLSETRGHCL